MYKMFNMSTIKKLTLKEIICDETGMSLLQHPFSIHTIANYGSKKHGLNAVCLVAEALSQTTYANPPRRMRLFE